MDQASTTVRVTRTTRDHLNTVAAARGETIDETIRRGLEAMERFDWERRAERDARAAAADPADRAEVAAAIRQLTGE